MSTGNFDSNVGGTPAISATGTNGAEGVVASTNSSVAISGITQNDTGGSYAPGVFGSSQVGPGVAGSSLSGPGVVGFSFNGPGVSGNSADSGVYGRGNNVGVYGTAASAVGGIDFSLVTPDSGPGGGGPVDVTGIGVHAVGGGATATPFLTSNVQQAAIFAEGGPGLGVYATSQSGTGVSGTTVSGVGVAANGGSEGVALQITGRIEVQGNSVGEVTVRKGAKTLTVNNAAATANSLILLTPLSNPGVFLWIGSRNAGSFTIDASNALPSAITLMYLIIN